ncbi:hypothetical protein SFBM_0277 [Candidatus Arthromitus sp. SFB-mouse-Japan]|uniref:hypothetical protein n=1 Tax=Candidatus Arthromitus sp. SFB-mouse TaxID=49118 RepID=UPI00021B7D59|nr:hypothetical protein [Candidatus Arthromitus sp. SFB-mouse]EIA22324.1 hypothetical protein SFB1_293G9 [Candidatus Arthromitus sp. SFB-1]EIA29461.1 hypothetical protein SFB6_002G29 [Candidatus Arthromitus sp. SFB-co]EIA30323.1 hypothetical protein SFBSU_006G4 [Candidatus Arthromitus sp. SFB-mouse-SU]EGX29277.1 hypothetical protein SFBNYU_013290 [Candidatus Arthromitus sp. SFB-mouse-NYU]BAK56056.1 hypothetical protein SFBM_0277 [Candidatus Arthromitus sp. SFB-mouse-Japan]
MKFRKIIKFNFILLFMYLIINVMSCSTFNASLDSLLVAPKVENILVKGTWNLDSFYYMYNKNTGITPKIPSDSYLFISDYYLRINDLLFEYDTFKVKTFMLSDYMRVKFKIDDFSFLNLEDKSVNIFTIQDEDKNMHEFIKYDDDTILFYYDDDIMYSFKKVSNKIDTEIEGFVKDNLKNNVITYDGEYMNNVGFLISFRSERKVTDHSIPKSVYKSIWVYQNNDGTYAHKVFDDIIVPKDGKILNISVESSDKNDLYEKIAIDDLLSDDVFILDGDNNTNEEFINQFIDITYVNENYIGINYDQNIEYLGNINIDKCAMLSIDDPVIERRLKFSDIFQKSVKIFYNSYYKFINLLKKVNLDAYDTEPREDSFKLERYGGDWFLKGRVNTKLPSSTLKPLDFDIELLPNKKLISENNVSANLGQIKLRNPEARDAFMSPDRDLVVILTSTTMGVYKIIGDKISNNAILELSIDSGDNVILGEWYTGDKAVEVELLLEKLE